MSSYFGSFEKSCLRLPLRFALREGAFDAGNGSLTKSYRYRSFTHDCLEPHTAGALLLFPSDAIAILTQEIHHTPAKPIVRHTTDYHTTSQIADVTGKEEQRLLCEGAGEGQTAQVASHEQKLLPICATSTFGFRRTPTQLPP